jgi:hypothetical protein
VVDQTKLVLVLVVILLALEVVTELQEELEGVQVWELQTLPVVLVVKL